MWWPFNRKKQPTIKEEIARQEVVKRQAVRQSRVASSAPVSRRSFYASETPIESDDFDSTDILLAAGELMTVVEDKPTRTIVEPTVTYGDSHTPYEPSYTPPSWGALERESRPTDSTDCGHRGDEGHSSPSSSYESSSSYSSSSDSSSSSSSCDSSSSSSGGGDY